MSQILESQESYSLSQSDLGTSHTISNSEYDLGPELTQLRFHKEQLNLGINYLKDSGNTVKKTSLVTKRFG